MLKIEKHSHQVVKREQHQSEKENFLRLELIWFSWNGLCDSYDIFLFAFMALIHYLISHTNETILIRRYRNVHFLAPNDGNKIMGIDKSKKTTFFYENISEQMCCQQTSEQFLYKKKCGTNHVYERNLHFARSSTTNLPNDYGHHTDTETHKHRDTHVHIGRPQIDARTFPGV